MSTCIENVGEVDEYTWKAKTHGSDEDPPEGNLMVQYNKPVKLN